MPLLKKEWSPREADEWTREDTLTVIISPVIYVLVLVGGAMSALMMRTGFILLGAAVVLLVLMVRIINPKLSAISTAYEKKQKHYIEELEKKMKWED